MISRINCRRPSGSRDQINYMARGQFVHISVVVVGDVMELDLIVRVGRGGSGTDKLIY